MLRHIVLNTRTLKTRFSVATTSVLLRSFIAVANKNGLFSTPVNASHSVVASKQHRPQHVIVKSALLNGNLVGLRSYAKKATAPKKAAPKYAVKANEVAATAVPEVPDNQGPICFVQVAQKIIPDPEKNNGGEDECFISEDKSVFGVFDGVGGCADRGGKPREYALALAKGGKMLSDTTSTRDPKKIMEAGSIEAKPIDGASTACVAAMKDGKVHMANMGDSGMFIIRPSNTTVFRSKEQQIRFNVPYQLPHQAIDLVHCEQVTVAKGDVVILATDGVFDNIFDKDMIALVDKIVKEHQDAKDLADKLATAIANEASLIANDKNKKTPWEAAVSKHYRSGAHSGGKVDDITVVVGVVGNVENNVTENEGEAAKQAPIRERQDLGL